MPVCPPANHTQAAEFLNLVEAGDLTAETVLLAENGVRRPKTKRLQRLQRLQSTLDFTSLARNELELKANLYFHICNPVKRWRVERIVPIKLLLQLLKTFVLLTQVREGMKEQTVYGISIDITSCLVFSV